MTSPFLAIGRHRPHCLSRGVKVKVALFDILMELTVCYIALLAISITPNQYRPERGPS